LFGYKKGAFTGAQTDKEGLFEMAEGGSLLLDEIGEMPPYLQTKLLRVLQEREYRPIGSDRIVRVDFRLVCATNIDLDAALRDGKLREDLYFRINTITLRVPPHRTLAEIEKMAIVQTLHRTNWNKQEAAQILGLYRPTLYSKMKKHDIQDGGKSGARRAVGA